MPYTVIDLFMFPMAEAKINKGGDVASSPFKYRFDGLMWPSSNLALKKFSWKKSRNVVMCYWNVNS